MARRVFMENSFWNQPLAQNPDIDPSSARWIDILAGEKDPNFWVNTDKWTIPVYDVSPDTPHHRVAPYAMKHWNDRSGHGASFEQPVPIPAHAVADPAGDKHIAVIDWERRKIWDMFFAHKNEHGRWDAFTGMTYDLDGDGVFVDGEFAVKPGESIHLYGPGRAAGVPIIAGLIMQDELRSGRIDHKLAFATGCNAYQQYVWPATWTDGFTEGGLPEGCVIQLDPSLDLARFKLTPAGLAIACALQVYGAVNVDVAGGTVLYAEGLYGQDSRSWDGLLTGDVLRGIDIRHYRVLKTPPVKSGGKAHPPERRGTWSTARA